MNQDQGSSGRGKAEPEGAEIGSGSDAVAGDAANLIPFGHGPQAALPNLNNNEPDFIDDFQLGRVVPIEERRSWLPELSKAERRSTDTWRALDTGEQPLVLDVADDTLVLGYAEFDQAKAAGRQRVPVVRRHFASRDAMVAFAIRSTMHHPKLRGLLGYLVYVRHRETIDRLVEVERAGANVGTGSDILAHQKKTRAMIGRLVGISGSSFDNYRRIAESAPELMSKLREGKIRFRDAEAALKELRNSEGSRRGGTKADGKEPAANVPPEDLPSAALVSEEDPDPTGDPAVDLERVTVARAERLHRMLIDNYLLVADMPDEALLRMNSSIEGAKQSLTSAQRRIAALLAARRGNDRAA